VCVNWGLEESHWWKPRTLRPASGQRSRVCRIKLGVGVMWEKLRWRRFETERGSEFGSFRSSEETLCAIGSIWVSDEKCLVIKSEGEKRVLKWKWVEECRGKRGGGG